MKHKPLTAAECTTLSIDALGDIVRHPRRPAYAQLARAELTMRGRCEFRTCVKYATAEVVLGMGACIQTALCCRYHAERWGDGGALPRTSVDALPPRDDSPQEYCAAYAREWGGK